jgi:hypothetical protein
MRLSFVQRGKCQPRARESRLLYVTMRRVSATLCFGSDAEQQRRATVELNARDQVSITIFSRLSASLAKDSS